MLNTKKLKARMKELGMTQADLAGKVGLATPTLCQKLNNVRPFSLPQAEKVALALDISAQELASYFFSS